MARRVFFSFDYERDFWRVSQVRNCWMATPERETAGFIEAASWEEKTWKGKEAVRKWIDRELERTSITVVLIGYTTSSDEFVNYEIKQSRLLGKALFGIYIHNLKDRDGKADLKGKNPFDNFCVEEKGKMTHLSQIYPTYDWIEDDGCNNSADWVEKTVRKVRR
jgi:hypothetical protein